jgi:hypothetical protein
MAEIKRATIVIKQEHSSSGNDAARNWAGIDDEQFLFTIHLESQGGDGIVPTDLATVWAVGTGLFANLSGTFESGNGTYDSHFYDNEVTPFSGVLDILNLQRMQEFNPYNVSGLAAWYDASRETAFSDDDPITTIQDFSFAGNEITQTSGALKPHWRSSALAGDKPAFRFDGIDDSMTITDGTSGISLDNYTVIFNGVPQTMNNNALIGLFNSNASNIGWASDTRTRLRISGVNQNIPFSPAGTGFTSGVQQVYIERRRRGSSGLIEAYINKVPFVGPHAQSSGVHLQSNILMSHIGVDGDFTGANFDGDIGDLLIYNKRVRPRDLRILVQYLANKYEPVPFTPKSVNGLTAWWDASQETIYTSGSAVSGMTDFGPSGYHAQQSTSGNEPTYITNALSGIGSGSRPAFSFDGTNDHMDVTPLAPSGVNNYTVFLVFNSPSHSTNSILGVNGTNNRFFEITTSGSSTLRLSGGGHTLNMGSGYQTNVTHIFTETRQNPNSNRTIYMDGNPTAQASGTSNPQATTFNLSNLFVDGDGTGRNFSGLVGELILYNRALDATELSGVHTYLREKYGVG